MDWTRWGPGEWMLFFGAVGSVGAYATRFILILGRIAELLFSLQCWLEVLSEEYPEVGRKVATRIAAKPVLRKPSFFSAPGSSAGAESPT